MYLTLHDRIRLKESIERLLTVNQKYIDPSKLVENFSDFLINQTEKELSSYFRYTEECVATNRNHGFNITQFDIMAKDAFRIFDESQKGNKVILEEGKIILKRNENDLLFEEDEEELPSIDDEYYKY